VLGRVHVLTQEDNMSWLSWHLSGTLRQCTPLVQYRERYWMIFKYKLNLYLFARQVHFKIYLSAKMFTCSSSCHGKHKILKNARLKTFLLSLGTQFFKPHCKLCKSNTKDLQTNLVNTQYSSIAPSPPVHKAYPIAKSSNTQ